MPGRAEIFKSLARSLAGKPDIAAKLVAAEKNLAAARAAESGSLTGMAARGVLSVAPKSRARIEDVLAKAYTKARAADVSLAERAAKLPAIGWLFRTQERIPVSSLARTPAGEVKELIEVPAASLLAPAEKAQRLAVPLLAFMGAEAVMRPRGGGDTGMAQSEKPEKYSHVLKTAASTMRQQQKAMEHLADTVIQKESELAAAKKAVTMLKEATDFTVELARRGVVAPEGIGEKIAELVKKGERGLEVEKAALDLVEKRATSLGTAEGDAADDEVPADNYGSNPVIAYLSEYAYSHEAAQSSED